MTQPEFMAACPQCGSSAGVHAIGELADLARMQLGQPQPAANALAGQGYLAEPQAGPLPGNLGQPQTGPLPGKPWSRRGSRWNERLDTDAGDSIGEALGDAVAGAAITAAAGLIGRAIRKRAEKALTERVLPAVAASRNAALEQQIAIAERHPGLRACLTDQVVFLDGGTRTVPLPNLSALTMQQADAIVAELQNR